VLTGNLRDMRVAHSLLFGLAQFRGIHITAVCPERLAPPRECADVFVAGGNHYEERGVLPDLRDVDVLYVAGFPPNTTHDRWDDDARAPYRVTAAVAAELSADAVILCPLPRVDEIEVGVDDLPQARYFRQSELGLFMRMAVLDYVLGSHH
jgi:aspartate carbamoyltransferase catalytic subunit